MSIKFKSNIESEGKIIQSKHRAIKHTDTVQTLEVKVVTKTAAHPEHGNGSSYGYTIDGVEGAYLELTPGITYRFDQSDGSNGGTGTGGSAHPLAFYEDAAKTTAYNTQVTTNGSPGSSGAYTQIIPTTSTPPILFYQCTSHPLMGSYAKFGTGTVGDTYSINVATDGSNVDLNLDAASGTDSTVQLTAGTNITLTRNDAQQVTIASTASGDTYDLNAVQDGNNVDINLTSGSGSDNSVVQLTAGTGITLTRNSAAEVTVASSASGSAGQVTTQINISGSSPTQATDGSRTAFTISSTPASENNLQIYLDGVYQAKNTFSVSGTTVTLSTAPPTGSSLEIIHFIVVNANIFLQTHTTANNSTTSFNAGGTISSENDTQVYIDGVYQSKSNYSVSGSNVVLSTAPATGAVVEIVNIRATAGDNDSGSVEWQTAIKTSNFTAEASKGYFVNTTSGEITVSLPAGSVGDEIHFTDYASTFDTNKIIFDANGSEKIQGSTDNKKCSVENATIRLIYQDATKGWTAGNLSPLAVPYAVKYLVVAGGGSAGGGAYAFANGGGGGGAGGLRTNNTGDTSGGGNAASNETSVTFQPNTSYTITVGAGGTSTTGVGDDGDDSSITGSDITDIVSTGGGGGGAEVSGVGQVSGRAGGSGGGGPHGNNTSGGGAATTNQGYAGANGGNGSGGGGGGAGAAGSAGSGYSAGNGGIGAISTIISSLIAGSQSVGEVNSSNVYFAGGGGGGNYYSGSAGTGGLGGGGDGSTTTSPQAGAPNTGGGGGGRNYHTNSGGGGSAGGNGGSGAVILRIPTASYSGTTINLGHSYTDGTETVLIFKQTGTIVG